MVLSLVMINLIVMIEMSVLARLVLMDIVKIRMDHLFVNVKWDMNWLMMESPVWIETNV
jgi:hypothetical protein